MSQWLLQVGTSTGDPEKGIYGMAYNGVPEKDGKFTLIQKAMNPSYIILGPDATRVYAVLETDRREEGQGGGVASYQVDPKTGALTLTSEQLTLGRGPCYLTVDRNSHVLYTANYNDGTVSTFRLAEDGSILPLNALFLHHGEAGERPHAHCAAFSPDNARLWVCDLGLDTLMCYYWDEKTSTLMLDQELTLPLEKGKGPRHILFHKSNGFAYVIDELASRINALAWDAKTGSLTLKQTLSLLPEDYTGRNGAAALRMSADGRFLYCSNRGHESIAVFAIGEDGLLTLVQIAPCGGAFPRDIDLDPTGRYMFVANQRSDSISVLAVDPETGKLSPTDYSYEVPGPTCILFVPVD